MKIISSLLAFILFTAAAFAQTKTDTIHRYYNKDIDTIGMGQYGMRLYDARIKMYLPPDTDYKQNPYYFADKKKKHKKSR